MPVSDTEIVQDVVDRLLTLNLFGEIVRGASPDQEEVAVGDEPTVWVQKVGWRQSPRDSDGDRYRDLQISIWIHVRGNRPEDRSRELDGLEDAVCDALIGKKLGGVCLPSFSLITAASQRNRPAERSASSLLTLTCRYRKIVPAPG